MWIHKKDLYSPLSRSLVIFEKIMMLFYYIENRFLGKKNLQNYYKPFKKQLISF